ncbi:MAG: M28 family peptidase [Saprospiraceae bacterium]|nr:M28 family peptidase [Saprospiraceae bacterium]
MMKKLLLLVILFCTTQSFGQKLNKLPESKIPAIETETHLRFIASDELMGRKTGEQGNLVAARYITEQFRLLGLKPAGGDSYMQLVPFKSTKPATEGSIVAGDSTLKILDDFIVFDGKSADMHNVPVVFANYGWIDGKGYDDYKDLDVKGKIVVIQLGTPDTKKPFEAIQASDAKAKFAADRGAVAVVEIFTAQIPWKNLLRFFTSESLRLASDKTESSIPHLWVNAARGGAFSKDKLKSLTMHTSEKKETNVVSYNVAGVLEGTDPVLKKEYIVLSAHFDHIGINRTNKTDSISNGARDNAFGVTAMLFAAKAFSQMCTKRSILFIGYTGEEIGLLGSKYYVEHPLVPLKQCVFNLNCDGAGYDDTSLLTTIGLSRTDAKAELETSAKAFGLKIIDDSAPEQNLFDRSDNVNFAAKGIPAPNFAPGMKTFGGEIMKYYHQTSDNPETIDFPYLHKYCQAYAYAARLIANRATPPKWIAGDKYEKAWNELFGGK